MEKIIKKIIVVKLGRNIATSRRNKIDEFRFEQLAMQIKLLQQHDVGVVLVVSAAVNCGEWALGLKGDYEIAKQLVGGVGQAQVIAELVRIFTKHKVKIGQLLLTRDNLEHEQKKENIQNLLYESVDQNIVFILNENDAVDLHSFGGNDHLAMEIAKLMHADLLLLLTDVNGVLDEKMKRIKFFEKNKEIGQVIKQARTGGIGGMQGKLELSIYAAEQGIETWIAYGKTKDILTRIMLGKKHIGTKILGGAL